MSSQDAQSDAVSASVGESNSMSFTVGGVIDGFRSGVSIAIAVALFGFVFGVLASQTGLSPVEATLMSVLVFAGAAQFVAIDLWGDPIPMIAVIVASFTVNIRYMLFGAALREWFSDRSARVVYPNLMMMTDESWALTIKEFKNGYRDDAFLFGSGLIVWIGWWGATALGTQAGMLITDPSSFGFGVVLTAVFLTLLVGLWEGPSDFIPWSVAAGVAVGAEQFLPGNWFIVLGGVAGSVVAMIRFSDDD